MTAKQLNEIIKACPNIQFVTIGDLKKAGEKKAGEKKDENKK